MPNAKSLPFLRILTVPPSGRAERGPSGRAAGGPEEAEEQPLQGPEGGGGRAAHCCTARRILNPEGLGAGESGGGGPTPSIPLLAF